jgi:DNA-binding response OmpR family regulator
MPLTGHRILLVEDEIVIAFDIISSVRQAHGEVVAHAASLAAALRLANTPGLSSAILDYRLGPDNSLPVAAKLHAAGVPFIFHTAHLEAVAEVWPGVPILAKPALRGELVASLASLVTNRANRIDTSTIK